MAGKRGAPLLMMSSALVMSLGCGSSDGDDVWNGGGDGATRGNDGDATHGGGADGTDRGDDDDDDDAATLDAGDDDDDDTVDESGGGIKLDVGAAETGGIGGGCAEGDEGCSCTAVDVLFVIDNSGTMCTKQEQLAAAFPGFVTAMFEALPSGTDLHVGITTSGFELGGSHSETNCVAQEDQATIEAHYVRPGEGMVAGNGLQGRLYEHQGMRWFEADTSNAADQAALTNWFTAAATGVGCGVSSFEFNASGAAWALHPDNAATNDGFLRDEGAVLVLFILTDEGDQSTEVESLDFLHDTVVDAKAGCGGDACVVAGGLLPTYCPAKTNGSLAFLETFGAAPTVGDIGFGFGPVDYEATVGDTFATVVAAACDEIVPEG